MWFLPGLQSPLRHRAAVLVVLGNRISSDWASAKEPVLQKQFPYSRLASPFCQQSHRSSWHAGPLGDEHRRHSRG